MTILDPGCTHPNPTTFSTGVTVPDVVEDGRPPIPTKARRLVPASEVKEYLMTHWRKPNHQAMGASRMPISDWTVFGLTVGLACVIAAVGWMTS